MNTINKAFLTIAAAAAITGATETAHAQKGGARPAFEKGSKTLGFGLGGGVEYGYQQTKFNHLPLVFAMYDQGIINNVGPGTIGIGGIVAVKSSSYKHGNGYKNRYLNYMVGARATYHLTILKDKNNKFDPYGGVTAGLRFSSFHDDFLDRTDSDVDPILGLFVGAKYNFVPSFGAFAELGYDISVLRAGFHFNF